MDLVQLERHRRNRRCSSKQRCVEAQAQGIQFEAERATKLTARASDGPFPSVEVIGNDIGRTENEVIHARNTTPAVMTQVLTGDRISVGGINTIEARQ